jgi:Na+/melibiose symporter-like transporter
MEVLVLWLVCAVITAVIASAKGRSGFGWFLLGAILGIFGVILIACMPSLNRAPLVVTAAPDDRPTKNCPDCGETILLVANVCKHCGKRFGNYGASAV